MKKKVKFRNGKYLSVGDRITINARYGATVHKLGVRVYQLYERFCVLDTGKFKVSAFYDDIRNKAHIWI